MAIQIGTVDGLIYIGSKKIECFVNAIDEFSKGGIEFAEKNGLAFGTAFQRFVEPVYVNKSIDFKLESILEPAYTKLGKEQSPARGTYCRKMGLLHVEEKEKIFELTPLGRALKDEQININDYAFILLSKLGVFVNGVYKDNVLAFISKIFIEESYISESIIKERVCEFFKDDEIEKTRVDIILGALELCGLVTKVATGVYVLSNIEYAEILKDFHINRSLLTSSKLDSQEEYTDYMGALDYGVFDVLSIRNKEIYAKAFPNLLKYMKEESGFGKGISINSPLQQIFYGAPGTGKSHTIDDKTNESNRIRITFHPDYDYATFVGAYKPTVKEVDRYGLFGKDTVAMKHDDDTPIKEDVIVYKFIPQAFVKAYVEAWRRHVDTECTDKEFYLVIEEINRGNCAQIFGDLFQLLDRTSAGFSSYAVETDNDLQRFLAEDDEYKLDIVLAEDIKNDNGNVIASAENVMCGKVLVLPPNLHIWATMNTSDQSLFPIDSAFKRRWDWVYMPIKYDNKDWKVVLEDGSWCSWIELQQTLNELIYDATESEDKMLGDWFVKAEDDKISVEVLVGKIIFYLWNDVAKVDAGKIFDLEVEKRGRKRKVIFSDFYNVDGTINSEVVKNWLKKIEVTVTEKITADADVDGSSETPTDE